MPAPQAAGRASYQRLEFLGDRVLALVVSEMLIEAFPKANEGELAQRLTALVRNESCAEVAMALDVGAAIRLGIGEAQAGGRHKAAILGDVCEALIGAIHLDGGIDAARRVRAGQLGGAHARLAGLDARRQDDAPGMGAGQGHRHAGLCHRRAARAGPRAALRRRSDDRVARAAAGARGGRGATRSSSRPPRCSSAKAYGRR